MEFATTIRYAIAMNCGKENFAKTVRINIFYFLMGKLTEISGVSILNGELNHGDVVFLVVLFVVIVPVVIPLCCVKSIKTPLKSH
jgi:hypothetical protein